MMQSPKVGIVIPAFNAERFIEDCLHSTIDQDYDNFRIFVVDDASTDRTLDVITGIAAAHPDKITWHTRPDNRGEAFTRQEATEMALADGCDYIAPLDADDVRKPGMIGRQVAILEQTPNAAVCYGRSDIINSRGELHSNPRWERRIAWLKGLPEGEVWSNLIAFGKLGTMDTVVIRAEAARMCRYDPNFRYFADVDYLAQIATLAQNANFVALDEIVASYRFHAGQALRIGSEELVRVMYHTMQTVAMRVFCRLEKQGRPVPCRKRRKLWRLLVARTILNAVRRREWGGMSDLARDLAMPIRRLEARYRQLKGAGKLDELLGAWAKDM